MALSKTQEYGRTVIITDRFLERRAPSASKTNPTTTSKPEAHIDRYRITRQLSDGVTGQIYQAQDIELNRPVVLKMLAPDLCRRPDCLNRFRAEARAQARLQSPYIVTLYSMIEHLQRAMLVLEYIEGVTLEERIRTYGPLAPSEAITVFNQTLIALEHMHAMDVVHRDLKPGNIFVTTEGGIKISDFGVARILDEDRLTNGEVAGTLLYIAPEQLNGRAVDKRSDIYTVGIGLYEAVTGRMPFECHSVYTLIHAHTQETPPSPCRVQSKIPVALERVILKALEKDPSRRFQSAVEFRAALLKLNLINTQPSLGLNLPITHDSTASRTSAQRFFRGFGFDLILVVAVFLLFYGLNIGFTPWKSMASSTSNSATTISKKTSNNSLRSSKKRAVPIASPQTPLVTKEPPTSNVENYESLRKAWGE